MTYEKINWMVIIPSMGRHSRCAYQSILIYMYLILSPFYGRIKPDKLIQTNEYCCNCINLSGAPSNVAHKFKITP